MQIETGGNLRSAEALKKGGAGDVAPVAPPEQRVGTKGKGKAVAAPINEHVAGDESD